MKDNHPITPPPQLTRQWMHVCNIEIAPFHLAQALTTQAARWGSDQELEACVEWLGEAPVMYDGDENLHPGSYLRDARRPKPPTLKEQALAALEHVEEGWRPVPADCEIIRRALEQLSDG